MSDDRRSHDPSKTLAVMMAGEKPGGHGERCVAVGAKDMAMWDLAAKALDLPLWRLLKETYGNKDANADVPVYASGGYLYPEDDLGLLREQAEWMQATGFRRSKVKIGASSLTVDLQRIQTVLDIFKDGSSVAFDAMNLYSPQDALEVADQLKDFGLGWFEGVCDPLDFETHRRVTERYEPPISAGEALFSKSDARNLLRYGGLRAGHDLLTFDPAHSYGIDEYLRIIRLFESAG